MTDKIQIRCATEQDSAAIAQLSGDLGYATNPEIMQQRVREVLASTMDLLLVAVDSSGQAVGWLQAHAAHIVESGFRVEITGLIVSPSLRRSGVGRALIKEAERWAKNRSAQVIVVRSNIKRVESHAFYPALGYTATKTQQVYRKPLA